MDKNIEFKTHNLELEFLNIDSRLQVIIYALSGFVSFNFGKNITLTELMRTQEMQDSYYSSNPKYKIKPFKSVHQFGRGADISVKYFTDEELKDIYLFLNKSFAYSNAFKTAVIHDVGLGKHLHIQVDSDGATEILA